MGTCPRSARAAFSMAISDSGTCWPASEVRPAGFAGFTGLLIVFGLRGLRAQSVDPEVEGCTVMNGASQTINALSLRNCTIASQGGRKSTHNINELLAETAAQKWNLH